MVDEAKDHDATSSNGTAPRFASAPLTASSPIEEAVIVEEQITPHPQAPKTPTNSAAAPTPTAESDSVQAIRVAPPSLRPQTPPTPEVSHDESPTPPEASTETHVHRASVIPPISTVIDIGEIDAPPTSAIAPSVPSPQPNTSPVRENMANILKSVKLPERFDQKGAADPKAAPNAGQSTKVVTEIITPKMNIEAAERNPVSSLHTLKHDLQDISREQKVSLVHAVSLEEDRRAHARETETPAVQQRSKRTFVMLFAVLFLLTIGGGIFAITVSMAQKPSQVPPALSSPSLLFAEDSVVLPLTKSSSVELRRALGDGRTALNKTLGSITRVVPVVTTINQDGTKSEVPATLTEYLKGVGARAPDDLLRALDNQFFLGIHSIGENAPLIVVPVISYERAFAGMLAWERNLNADLVPLFTQVPTLINESGLPQTRIYQDLVMRNHDVRALKDDRGEIQLYYAFPNQDILVIAESPYSFVEILSRLQAQRNL